MIRESDDLGRTVCLETPPQRIVSLVPSDTLTIIQLAGLARLVGRTDYCNDPPEVVDVPSVGGTKSASVAKILALEPDLVIVNQEENAQPAVEALLASGLNVFVVFPKTVAEGITLVARLANLLAVREQPSVQSLLGALDEALRCALAQRSTNTPLRTFCPIWMEPLMTANGATYLSDALDLAGFQNVFAERQRRYPLSADLGKAKGETSSPAKPGRSAARDTRYPRITLEELRQREPEVVLLPSEPHPFGHEEAEIFRQLLPEARILPIDGKDICWYGAHAAIALPRLGALVAALGLGADQGKRRADSQSA